MNYELAKELKDAGWPQSQESYEKDAVPPYIGKTYMGTTRPLTEQEMQEGGWEKSLPRPSLSELIEKCGEEFISLEKREDGWAATGMRGNTIHTSRLKLSPKEAVARLWLALNKNN